MGVIRLQTLQDFTRTKGGVPCCILILAGGTQDEFYFTLVCCYPWSQFSAKQDLITVYGHILDQIGILVAVRVAVVDPQKTTGEIQVITHIPGSLEAFHLRASIGLHTENLIGGRDGELPGAGIYNNQITTSALQTHLGQHETDQSSSDGPYDLIDQGIPPLRRFFFQVGHFGI